MKQFKIGRSSLNDVVYIDPTVSSQHAVLTIDNGQCRIKDLNSTNGTFVNGVRITAETPLKPGDTVRLGNYAIAWQGLINNPPKTVVNRQPVPTPTGDIVASRKIGRVKEGNDDIVYPHSDVSVKHAFLVKNKQGQVLIVDNNSTNGTYVNGRKVTSAVLQKGDRVMIANKYALNWESIYPPKSPTRINPAMWAGIAAAALVVVLLILKPWAGWTPGHKGSAQDIYAYYNKAVVLIYQTYYYEAKVNGQTVGRYVIGDDGAPASMEDYGGPNGSFGTGFFVSADGKIMTNRHVMNPAMTEQKNADMIKASLRSYFIQQAAGDQKRAKKYREYADGLDVSIVVYSTSAAVNDTYVSTLNDFAPCTVLGDTGSDEVDLGLIQINAKRLPDGSRYVDLSHIDTDIKEGKDIYTIGFPRALSIGTTAQGVEAQKQSGHISQLRGGVQFGHNLNIDHGSSGSPIFNNKGRLIGVVNAGFFASAGNFNIGIQSKHAVSLLNEYN